MTAIFKREFKAFYTSPIGYVVTAVLLLFQGLYFAMMYSYGYPDVTYVFEMSFTIIFFIVPILTMRLLSEDRRQKVDQALMTAPVSLWGIVLGKFLAAVAVFMLSFSVTLVFQVIISFYVTLNWFIYIGNIVGLLLFGGSLISIGLFVSSLTESQVVAAVGTFAISFSIFMLDDIAGLINNSVVTSIVKAISFKGRYDTFVSGIFDYSNAVFFLSFIAVFLFLAVRMLEKKRYS